MKEIVHVIVGAGQVHYFLNAIQSVRRFGAGDIYACYNWVDEADLESLERVSPRVLSMTSNLDVRKNESTFRTGSLYEANNGALEYARGRYRFASFMQADMQLMWWDEKILNEADRIISQHQQDQDEISFYTQLPVLGKHANPYAAWVRNEITGTFTQHSHVDVCLVPLDRGLNSNLRFDENERSMMISAEQSGTMLHWHPYPYLAPIPFPQTTRHRKGPGDMQVTDGGAVLDVAPGYSADFSLAELHPFSMERCVVPRGWQSAYPFWPSDTKGTEWIRRRLDYKRQTNGHLFSHVDQNQAFSRSFFGHYRPGTRKILWSLMLLISVESIRRFKKQLKRVVALMR